LAKAIPLVAMLQTTKTLSSHGLNLLAALSSHVLAFLQYANKILLLPDQTDRCLNSRFDQAFIYEYYRSYRGVLIGKIIDGYRME